MISFYTDLTNDAPTFLEAQQLDHLCTFLFPWHPVTYQALLMGSVSHLPILSFLLPGPIHTFLN